MFRSLSIRMKMLLLVLCTGTLSMFALSALLTWNLADVVKDEIRRAEDSAINVVSDELFEAYSEAGLSFERAGNGDVRGVIGKAVAVQPVEPERAVEQPDPARIVERRKPVRARSLPVIMIFIIQRHEPHDAASSL